MTKKIMGLFLLIAAALMLPLAASAASVDDLKFDAKTGTIMICDKFARGELIIPREINGVTVTSIADTAFEDCSSLTSIRIPDSVTSIGDYCTFLGCSSLTSINVDPQNDYYCSIDGNLFDKSKETLIQYAIGKKDSEYTIPNGVTNIGDYAFDGCSGLTSISIPNGVTNIGDHAFEGCSSLTSIRIPDSVTSIGSYYTFSGCISLTSINVDPQNDYYCSIDGNFFDKGKETLIQYAIGKKDSEYTVPGGVTRIGEVAFEGCSSLKSVSIPNSVTSIGEMAFEDCSNLKSVNIPDSVTNIDNGVFEGCSSLTSINIPDRVTHIGDYVFEYCSNLTSINVDPQNSYYCSIDGNLFNKSKETLIQYAIGKKDSEYTIPDGVKFIRNTALQYCSSLKSINIPDSLISLDDWFAFTGCSSLTSINVDPQNDNYCSIDGVLFSKDKKNLIKCAMGKKDSEYTIPDGVTSIGWYAFYDCSGLKNINIPDSVTSIGSNTFAGCSGLISISIPYSVTSIYDAFTGCSSLTSINVDPQNDYYCSVDGNLYDKSKESMIQYAIGKKDSEYTIPDGVKDIAFAFAYCSNLTSVIIPDSVTSIGGSAFESCSNLTSISIPDSVTLIDINAFFNCTGLKDVYYSGTESQWNSIKISRYGNEPLAKVTIHYNSPLPTPVPTPTPIIPLEVEDVEPVVDEENQTVVVPVTVVDPERADELNEVELFVAEYDSDGRFVGLTLGTKGEIVGDTVVITADIPETDNYKFMLWDGNNVPLMDAVDNIYE